MEFVLAVVKSKDPHPEVINNQLCNKENMNHNNINLEHSGVMQVVGITVMKSNNPKEEDMYNSKRNHSIKGRKLHK